MFFTIVGAWVGCAGFGAYVAKERRRSLVEGAIFGGLLGPLGVLIEVLMPAGVVPDEGSQEDDSHRPLISVERWDTDTRNHFPRVKL